MSKPRVPGPVFRSRPLATRLRIGEFGLPLFLALACGVLAGCGSGGTKQAPDPDPPDPPVTVPTTTQMVVMCWDGAQREHTAAMMWGGALPNLKKVRDEGGLAATTVSVYPTETVTAHVAMLTGYPASVTGVHSRVEFQPIPRELTVLYRLKQHLGPQNITTVWVTSNSERINADPGGPWYEAKQDADVWDDGHHRVNSRTGRLCIEYLRAYAKPNDGFFFFLHFRDPDHSGHQHGENSAEYDAALMDDDKWLGRIRETLDELGVSATTALFVVTDHGFEEGKNIHKNAPDAWLATNWGPVVAGNQADVAPTILSAFGVDLSALSPPLPGKPLWAGPDE